MEIFPKCPDSVLKISTCENLALLTVVGCLEKDDTKGDTRKDDSIFKKWRVKCSGELTLQGD